MERKICNGCLNCRDEKNNCKGIEILKANPLKVKMHKSATVSVKAVTPGNSATVAKFANTSRIIENERGYSVIELIVVLSILSILGSILGGLGFVIFHFISKIW